MKITLSTLCAALILGLLVPVYAENQPTGYSLQATGRDTSPSPQITVRDYCNFLNAIAPSDPLDLYDEKMEIIERSGEDGCYSYVVAEGKADLPMNYLSWQDAAYYYDWKENAASTSTFNFDCCEVAVGCFAAYDEQLQSSWGTFSIVTAPTQAELNEKSGGKGPTGSALGKVAAMGGAVGFLLEGGRVPEERNNEDLRTSGNNTGEARSAAEQEHQRKMTEATNNVDRLKQELQTAKATRDQKQRELDALPWSVFESANKKALMKAVDAARLQCQKLENEHLPAAYRKVTELQRAAAVMKQQAVTTQQTTLPMPIPPMMRGTSDGSTTSTKSDRTGTLSSSDGSLPNSKALLLRNSNNSSDSEGHTSTEHSPDGTPEKRKEEVVTSQSNTSSVAIDPAALENIDASTLTEAVYNEFWRQYDLRVSQAAEVERLQKGHEAEVTRLKGLFSAAQEIREAKESAKDNISSIRVFKRQEADKAATEALFQEKAAERQLQAAQQRLVELKKSYEVVDNVAIPSITPYNGGSIEDLKEAYKKLQSAFRSNNSKEFKRCVIDNALHPGADVHWSLRIRQEALDNIGRFRREGTWVDYDSFGKPFFSRDATALNIKVQQAHLEFLESVMSYAQKHLKDDQNKFVGMAKKSFFITEEEKNSEALLSTEERTTKLKIAHDSAKNYLADTGAIVTRRKHSLKKIIGFRDTGVYEYAFYTGTYKAIGAFTSKDGEFLYRQTNALNLQCLEAAKHLERLRIAMLPEDQLQAEIKSISKLTPAAHEAEIFAIAGVKATTITEEDIAEVIQETKKLLEKREAEALDQEKIAKQEAAKRTGSSSSTSSSSSGNQETERLREFTRRQQLQNNLSWSGQQIQQQQYQQHVHQVNYQNMNTTMHIGKRW